MGSGLKIDFLTSIAIAIAIVLSTIANALLGYIVEWKGVFCSRHGSGYFHCSERNSKSAVVCYYFIRAHQLRTNQSA